MKAEFAGARRGPLPDMSGSGGRRRKILLVQRTGGGGSIINVLLLVQNLDRKRFDPLVLFYEPNSYEDRFRAAGADVRILDTAVPTRSVARLVPEGLQTGVGDRTRFRTLRRLNGFVQRDWRLARRIEKVIREVGADLVQTNICPSADRASILAAGLARVPQLSYCQFFSSDDAWLDRPLSTFVDRYLCISRAVRSQLREAAGIPEDRTRLVYAPFDFPVDPATPGAAGVRAGLGLHGGHRLVANVGRLVPWKGQDVFVRAFAAVAADHPDARALIVGSAGDKPEGRAFEASLRRIVADLGLGERVIFTGHRADIDAVMAASDVVVHSSSEPEPLGRVVMEAVALEKPVIATGAGGVPEMVRDGETGHLVTPGDVGAMGAALSSVLGDPGRAARMASRARQTARHRFSTRRFVRLIESEYARALAMDAR